MTMKLSQNEDTLTPGFMELLNEHDLFQIVRYDFIITI